VITVYGIPNCDTVKKARTWLEKHRIEYTFHDYKKAGIGKAVLEGWRASARQCWKAG
jgi:arsenate reductase